MPINVVDWLTLFRLDSVRHRDLLASLQESRLDRKMASNTEANGEITAFVQHWPERLPHYAALATFVGSKLQKLAAADKLRCRFDSRAKAMDTLEKSIYRRQASRQKKHGVDQGKFGTQEEIFEAMHDLAGVRVRLYFPSDTNNAQRLIMEEFDPQVTHHPGTRGNPQTDDSLQAQYDSQAEDDGQTENDLYTQTELRNKAWRSSKNVFSGIKRNILGHDSADVQSGGSSLEDRQDHLEYGTRDEWPLEYKARHYRCKLKRPDIEVFRQQYDTTLERFNFEIQVASLIMYAWADVYHDIIYKPFYGKITSDERTFLEIVNGLVHTGELALSQLQTSLLLRQEIEHSSFKTTRALGIWLTETLGYSADLEHLDLLGTFLSLVDVNTPAKLRPIISKNSSSLIRSDVQSKKIKYTLQPLRGTGEKHYLQAPVAINIIVLLLETRPEQGPPEQDHLCLAMIGGMSYRVFTLLTQAYEVGINLTDDELSLVSEHWGVLDLKRLERWYRIEKPYGPLPTGLFDFALKLVHHGFACVFHHSQTFRFSRDKLRYARQEHKEHMMSEAEEEERFMMDMLKQFESFDEEFNAETRLYYHWYCINWNDAWTLNDEREIFQRGFFDKLGEEQHPLRYTWSTGRTEMFNGVLIGS